MKAIVIVLMATALLAAGCATTPDIDQAKAPAEQMLLVADEPCEKTMAHVQKVLVETLSVGLHHQVDDQYGREFVTELRRDGDRQHRSVVRVECRDKQPTRIWVDVLAEKLGPDGVWLPDTDTEEIEKAILKALSR